MQRKEEIIFKTIHNWLYYSTQKEMKCKNI